MLINSSGVDLDGAEGIEDAQLMELPATEMAARMGEVRVANVIMLGALAERAGLVEERSCAHALRELMGRRKPELVELNLKALRRGAALAAG
jgi:2-oxoglutarate ferredoxin oxidoreductase subunit gamma